jgi:hypothetical protein
MLREHLLADANLKIDHCGWLFYAEPAHEDADTPPLPSSTPFPASDSFSLHSRLGANRVIYLDFDGHTVSGTAWNGGGADIHAPPYDTNGSPNTFSAAEHAAIQDIWRRVAEDFAPFDVDVTTEDPGFDAINRSSVGDVKYGTRVLITSAVGTTIQSTCSPTGCAYIGNFNYVAPDHAYRQPAWVFQAGLEGLGTKGIAEVTTHEAGHNLGLFHDGARAEPRTTRDTGAGRPLWAPDTTGRLCSGARASTAGLTTAKTIWSSSSRVALRCA